MNLGLNDESVQGLIKQTGNERLRDSYRRFVQCSLALLWVFPASSLRMQFLLKGRKRDVTLDTELTANDLRELVT